MENLFATEKIAELLPKITAFVQNELYPLETEQNMTSLFSSLEKTLNEKRELVKKLGLWGLQHHLTLYRQRYQEHPPLWLPSAVSEPHHG